MLGLLASLHQQTRWSCIPDLLFAMAMNLPSLWWIPRQHDTIRRHFLPVAFVLVAMLCAYLSLYPPFAAALLNRFFPKAGLPVCYWPSRVVVAQ